VPAWCAAIEHRQAQIPVIVVLADRLGADVLVSSERGTATVEVSGRDDDPIRKSAPGGWSQRRFQQRAENTWEHNASLVVDEIVAESRSLHPELVVLGGDLRAVQAIQDRLPKDLKPITHTMTSGRAIDGSDDRRHEDVERLVRTAVAEQTVRLLQTLEEQDGRDALAANGEVATFDALSRSQVDVLLVHDDGDDERQAWWSAAHGVGALDRAALDVLGGGADPVQGRLVDVAVTAALRSGASVRVVPDAAVLQDGIAALLRW
jgi:peptide subunit release factor 1 (eRF1)